MDGRTGGEGVIQWAVAARPLAGSVTSGDRAVVAEGPQKVLVAVVDGLGHGEAAAAVAELAVTVLRRHADKAITVAVQHCHSALLGTRGVALSLAVFDVHEQTLTWLGVGNVAGALLRADRRGRPRYEWLAVHGGIVGVQLPPLRAAVLPIRPGDTLVFATDGVRAEWQDEMWGGEPQRVADQLLARYGAATDDALVLVARNCGWAA